jgi:tetratricopeptide (TPR) repeat protein
MRRPERWLGGGLVLLALNGAYLWARDDPSLFYVANALFHVVMGIGVGLAAVPWLVRHARRGRWLGRATAALFALGLGAGIAIAVLGATRTWRPLLWAHAGSVAAALLLLPFALRAAHGAWPGLPRRTAAFVGAAFLLAGLLHLVPDGRRIAANNSGAPLGSYEVRNPLAPPVDMTGEHSGGANSPFFPSSVETVDGKFIPSAFFLDSDTCGRKGCHPDIVAQWRESAHRFSSFNNQWYRRSITYMQEVQGIHGSKWCAGCHDPAVLLTGLWTKPIAEQMDIPEAHAGLGCAACHAAVHVKNTMGNGGLIYEYPPLHRLASTESPLLRALHDYVVRVDPGPHRRTFLKPFHRAQTAEFCSTCHKVHLDKPVNNFRWVRGFNEYDAWQASGVSGQGALSFYYPARPQDCGDCHMPLVPSRDMGNVKGMVHSHRFPAANTALPFAWQLPDQARETTSFLTRDIITLDIFGMTAGGAGEALPAEAVARGATTFTLSGDETMLLHGAAGGRATDVAQLTAPLGVVTAAIRRGDSARVSVVVRTWGIGHRFPGGTFDAFDVWLELEARDQTGRVIFHSGGLEQDGRVDRGAHFYRAVMLDANGNIINKRNAWAARTVLYARGIPPGAADTVHFRLRVPEDCGDELTLTARLHYRKFDWWNTHFAYAGEPADTASYDLHHDDRTWKFTRNTSDVAGVVKSVPNLPIVTIAQSAATIRVLPTDAGAPAATVESKDLRERWNDYGIGLLLQGDLKGARAVFEKVARMDPEYPDGYVNVARAALREGDLRAAERNLRTARELLARTPRDNPHRAKAHYFLGEVLVARGDLDGALRELNTALDQYPRDRNVLNMIGRVHFLKRDFGSAIRFFERTCLVDPEDLAAHYNLMLSYRGMGDTQRARHHQTLYARFKADESAQAIAGDVRRRYPDLNLERQAIREHYGMALPSISPLDYGGSGRPETAQKRR